jgi:hypothetical protein
MALLDRYDWVVLGDHPGALLSGCFAAQLGYSVLFLPLVPSRHVSVSKTGQCFDPEPNAILGLGADAGRKGLLAESLSQMGGLTDTSGLLRSGDGVLPMIHTPRSRVALRAQNDDFMNELQREWNPAVARDTGLVDALGVIEPLSAAYWREFPSLLIRDPEKGWLSTESSGERMAGHLREHLARKSPGVKGASRQWIDSKTHVRNLALSRGANLALSQGVDFAEFGAGVWYGVHATESENPWLPDLAHALALARTGASFRGGLTAYREFLLNLARRLGAFVVEDAACHRIFVENERLMGVQMTHRGKMIGVGGAVLGTALAHAKEFVSFSGKNRDDLLKESPLPSGWRFTLALTVHEEAIPPGMGTRVIWKEPGAPSLEIEVAEPSDYELGRSREKFIFLRTWLPFSPETLEPSYQKLVASRMFRQLTEIFPFLEYHVVNVFPDFRKGGQESEEEFREAYGFTATHRIPENLRCLSGTGIGCQSGITGLFVGNGESFPMLGSFGGTVAAFEAISRFARAQQQPGERKFERLWDFLQSPA